MFSVCRPAWSLYRQASVWAWTTSLRCSLRSAYTRTPYKGETYTISRICDRLEVRKNRYLTSRLHNADCDFEMPKRILIADDSELIRRQVRRMVDSDPQIEVCAEAENGAEAVSKTRKYRPDLVLIDVFMPEVNGFDAVREIKKRVPDTPVVIFTSYDSDTIRNESEKAGADVVLLKAKGGVELLPTIHKLLDTDPIAA